MDAGRGNGRVTVARLVIGWFCVVALFLAGDHLASLTPVFEGLLFVALLGVMLWCAFGVVAEADHLAEILKEPLGTLILTLAIVLIEVALISAVMLGGKDAPTLGRDTMFAVLMSVLNGIVGLGLLIGGVRHGQQRYNLQGASAYLAVIIPLSVISFLLPNFTRSTPGGTLSTGQEIAFSIFTLLLYAIFLFVQTGKHPGFFIDPHADADDDPAFETADTRGPGQGRRVVLHAALLVGSILPIVLLSKKLSILLEHGLSAASLPAALGGLLIALIVLAPEGITALRAVSANQLQRGVNLCLGAAASTIGLTVPAIVAVSMITGQTIVLGLDQAEMVLLATTLVLCTLTFSGARTTILEGAMHLMMFFVYLTLIFWPQVRRDGRGIAAPLTAARFFEQPCAPRGRGVEGVAIMTLTKTFLALCFAGALVAGPALAQTASPATPTSKPSMSSSMMKSAAPLLDINSAAKPDLMALKGVGDKRADDIIKGRPYKGKDDLVQKKILPQGVYDGIKDKIIAKQK